MVQTVPAELGAAADELGALLNKFGLDFREEAVLTGCPHFIADHEEEVARCEAQLKDLSDGLDAVDAYLDASEASLQEARNFRASLEKRSSSIRALKALVAQQLPNGAARARVAPAACNSSSAPAFSTTQPEELNGDSCALAERDTPTQPKQLRRNFITLEELQSCSSYLVGRLTVPKVNAALEALAELAEQNARQMTQLRRSGKSLNVKQRERLMVVAKILSDGDAKGTFWFLDSDLGTDRTTLKKDNTSKALLQLLRHLKRISEIRHKDKSLGIVYYFL